MEQMENKPENKPENKLSRMVKKLALALSLLVATEKGAHADMTVEQKAKMEEINKAHPELKKMFEVAGEVGEKESDVKIASNDTIPKSTTEGQK